MGIEPTYPAWKAGVLPLNYTRISVGVTGFEPATSWSQTRRSSQAEPHPESIVGRAAGYKSAGKSHADVAQLAEQLICNQQVIGSSPIIGFLKEQESLNKDH